MGYLKRTRTAGVVLPSQITHVEYFGPNVNEAGAGGIASVISVLLNHEGSGFTRGATATMALNRPLFSLDLFARSALKVLKLRASRSDVLAHVHVSDGGSLYREGGIACLASWVGIPTIVTLHSCMLDEVAKKNKRHLRAIVSAADITQVLGADGSEILAPFASRSVDVEVVANGVEIPETITDAGSEPSAVFFAGEVGQRKGADVLLAAWPAVRSAVPDAELILAGPLTDIEKPSGAGVTYIGMLRHEEIGSYLASSRLAVLPSRQEALPMFIIESMAYGRPIISTPVGEISSVLSAEQLVEVGNANDLADRMIALLDPVTATRVGRANRDIAVNRLSSEAMCNSIDEIYRRCLRNR